MVTTTDLFSGEPRSSGGLSNEQELAKICPAQFRSDNPWSDYAMRLFSLGGNIANWKWKSIDALEKRRQRACFKALLGTSDLTLEDKMAVAGWMLFEMLIEVPEHVLGKN